MPSSLNTDLKSKLNSDLNSKTNAENKFKGTQLFLTALMKQSARTNQVVARSYGNGAWSQFSGHDFCAHLGRASAIWLKQLPVLNSALDSNLETEKKPERQSVLFLCRNSYSSFVGALGAQLSGYDVMFLPQQVSHDDIKWCLKHFNGQALVADAQEVARSLSGFDVPVFNVGQTPWVAQDKHAEPQIFQDFRKYLADEKENLNTSSKKTKKDNEINLKVGNFQFISFGHDGFQKPEELMPDVLITVAQNFLIHVGVPPGLFWQSMELMPPSSPFAHLSRLCVLLKNGVLGFPNQSTDWQTNLMILRPTILFVGPAELSRVADFVQEVSQKPTYSPRLKVVEKLDKIRGFLKSGRALKLPEPIFEGAFRLLRTAGRLSVGSKFIADSVGSLRCVVHALAPARESDVKCLEQLGIPVIETYGVTAAGGLLSSNTFEAPHFNLIGSPLPHVSFRLGNGSVLEYRLNNPLFDRTNQERVGRWCETGDVAQMTPYGFVISGRQRHLFVTSGGQVISPARLESLLKAHPEIGDVCIVGDRMPFLIALVVLGAIAQSNWRESPEPVRQRIQDIIAGVNETLPRHATIKKFAILEKPFLEADGEKLSTGLVNRLRILETRKNIIQSLFT